METAGLHQLRFYPAELRDTPDPYYLDDITMELFGLPLTSFNKVPKITHNKRKYRMGYSFENKILLLADDYTKRRPLSIEINGGAFDHLCINVDKISRLIEEKYIISDIHAKIDTDITKFKQLFQCYQLDSVTAATLKGSDRQSSSRSIIFGTDPSYTIYEAGVFHPELQNKNITRHEIKFKGDQAQQFFKLWRQDPDNLATLIKSFIAGHFKVVFKDHTATDSNTSRRPVLPIWEKWLSSVAPRKFDRVEPTPPRLENQIKLWSEKLHNLKIELGEQVYSTILEKTDAMYKHHNWSSGKQEVQLSLFPD